MADGLSLVRAAYEAWNQDGLEALAPALAADVEAADPPQMPDARVWRGREAVLARFAEVAGAVGGGEVRIESLRRAGGEVLVSMHWVGDGASHPDFGAVHHLVAPADGSIARIRIFLDEAEALAAVRLVVPERFNGPLEAGNGGYSSGLFAGLVSGPAAVSLRRPVPLDTPLSVAAHDGGVGVLDGDALVAEAAPAPAVDLEVPDPVSVEEARAAARRYRGLDDGLFCRCFVCGRAREDSFGVFAGTVEGRDVVASPWTPPAWAADEDGTVRPEFVWAVLDCPTYFALYRDSLPMSFLARMSVRIDARPRAGEEQVAMAWPLEYDGRKHHAGGALLAADGRPLAVARALLVQARS